MAMNWQKGVLFAVGLTVGVAAGVAGVMAWHDSQSSRGPDPSRTLGGPAATSAVAPAAASTAVVAAGKECGVAPLLPRKGAEDGKLSLQAKPGAASAPEVAALILSGKEAAASGRERDAEVAFLNACRNAALLASEPIPAADAMYQLARHYANVAAFGAQPARELYARAERFYSASLLTYTARYGAGHEKTRFASEGLKTVQQATGGNGPVEVARVEAPKPAAPAPAPAPAPAQAAAPGQAPAVAAAPPLVAPPPAPKAPAPAQAAAGVQAPAVAAATARPAAPAPAATPTSQPAPAAPPAPAPQARRSNPSFDCARAHSATERLICADEDLARQDRELGRLHQRAREAAADPRAFQRESDAKWQQREDTCRDRECLQRWYAQRRAELDTAAAAAPRPSRRERAAAAEPSQRPQRAAAPEPAERPVAAEPAPRSSPPERREPTTAAGAGAARPLPDDEPQVRAPVVRAPPVRARVAEPEEQPAAPGVASGSAGDAPQAEGSADAP
ncbi:lysozyme inhibitor LprI family protein [Ramlibacter sp. AN1133]|uniref:lysozyme inhibitor LprI family protein n=1 Tax=Ramlibacter sp. AN1133 TaxID=3133429 RepID=UPI0030C0FEA4